LFCKYKFNIGEIPTMKLLTFLSLLFLSCTASATDDPVWEFDTVSGIWPTARLVDANSTAGIIVGSLWTEQKTPWWGYYTENVSNEFMVVGVVVDGETITLCDDETTFCNYIADPDNGAGGSFITLTNEDVKKIRDGERLEFIVEYDEQLVRIVRPLTGAQVVIDALLSMPDEIPPIENLINENWTMFELMDPILGRVVMIHGNVPDGEVTVSYSHAAFAGQFIPLPNYSGAELYFRPTGYEIAGIADIFWKGRGRDTTTTPIDFVDIVCKENNGTQCLARGGATVVLTEKDLLFLQSGRELMFLWMDENGNRYKSSVQLGTEINALNHRIRKLKGTPGDKTT
jgi:hypothetical protein